MGFVLWMAVSFLIPLCILEWTWPPVAISWWIHFLDQITTCGFLNHNLSQLRPSSSLQLRWLLPNLQIRSPLPQDLTILPLRPCKSIPHPPIFLPINRNKTTPQPTNPFSTSSNLLRTLSLSSPSPISKPYQQPHPSNHSSLTTPDKPPTSSFSSPKPSLLKAQEQMRV